MNLFSGSMLALSSRRLFSTTARQAMRFVQFSTPDKPECQLGVQVDSSKVINVSSALASETKGLLQMLQAGPSLWERIEKLVSDGSLPELPLSSISLLAPITGPDKVICVGLNYLTHCQEQNVKPPKEPMFFSKFASCIIGPDATIEYPPVTTMLDWEVELAAVIGLRARCVSPEDAMKHVFGFTVAQDVSARDWQKSRNGRQWLLGKSMDNFCPLGPAVVTTSEVNDPHTLRIECRVNGVTKQAGNTNDLVHRVPNIVSFLSQVITLLPGDVILTGTPSGVGLFRDPPEYLKVGDVIESEIERLGVLRNTVRK